MYFWQIEVILGILKQNRNTYLMSTNVKKNSCVFFI